MMSSSRAPRHLIIVSNSRHSRLCTPRGSGTGNSIAFPKNKKKTQERRVYKSTADLSPPQEKTPQWAMSLESSMKSERQSLESIMKSERQYLDSKIQALESSMKSEIKSLDSKMQSLESSMESKMQSLDSKMLGLAALMVGLAAVGFTATDHMIGGQNAKIDGQNAKIEAATMSKRLFHSHP
jgi:flagellar biosynthesis GTPase FlhF